MQLYGTCAANGALAIDGYRRFEGDLRSRLDGSARLRDLGTALRFEAALQEPDFGAGAEIVLELDRPKDVVSAPRSETYRISFGDSVALLAISYTGQRTTCAETTRVDANGDTVATIGAEICRVSPGGFIFLYAPYTTVDGDDFFPIQLSGFLSSVGGTYSIGFFPWEGSNGIWTAERIDD